MKQPPYNPNNIAEHPLEIYLERYVRCNPMEISKRLGIPYENGAFQLPVLGEPLAFTWPEGSPDYEAKVRILFLHYLLDGLPTVERNTFSSYAELPWGSIYAVNFKGRCIRFMVSLFGENLPAFERICQEFGGKPIRSSGTAYQIPFMPGYAVQLILWEGDEEFPASGQILFSDNFQDGFPAEDRVVLIEYLLQRMKERM